MVAHLLGTEEVQGQYLAWAPQHPCGQTAKAPEWKKYCYWTGHSGDIVSPHRKFKRKERRAARRRLKNSDRASAEH